MQAEIYIKQKLQTEMTQEQQRIKIAEACGWRVWRNLPTPETGEMMPAMMPPKHLHDQGEPMRFADELPDYLNDLNAMHEAEHRLKTVQWVIYERHIIAICKYAITWPIAATAEIRAEAFLKTLKLWIDEQD